MNVELDSKYISSLRVVDLKEELEKRGLSKSGSKKDLTERLKTYLKLQKERELSAARHDDEAPNNKLTKENADLANNDFIKQYLAKQQAQLTERKASRTSSEGGGGPSADNMDLNKSTEEESEDTADFTEPSVPAPEVCESAAAKKKSPAAAASTTADQPDQQSVPRSISSEKAGDTGGLAAKLSREDAKRSQDTSRKDSDSDSTEEEGGRDRRRSLDSDRRERNREKDDRRRSSKKDKKSSRRDSHHKGRSRESSREHDRKSDDKRSRKDKEDKKESERREKDARREERRERKEDERRKKKRDKDDHSEISEEDKRAREERKLQELIRRRLAERPGSTGNDGADKTTDTAEGSARLDVGPSRQRPVSPATKEGDKNQSVDIVHEKGTKMVDVGGEKKAAAPTDDGKKEGEVDKTSTSYEVKTQSSVTNIVGKEPAVVNVEQPAVKRVHVEDSVHSAEQKPFARNVPSVCEQAGSAKGRADESKSSHGSDARCAPGSGRHRSGQQKLESIGAERRQSAETEHVQPRVNSRQLDDKPAESPAETTQKDVSPRGRSKSPQEKDVLSSKRDSLDLSRSNERNLVEPSEDGQQADDKVVKPPVKTDQKAEISPKDKCSSDTQRLHSVEKIRGKSGVDRRQFENMAGETAQEKAATVSPKENESRERKRVKSRDDHRQSQEVTVEAGPEKTPTASSKEKDSMERKMSREGHHQSQDILVEAAHQKTTTVSHKDDEYRDRKRVESREDRRKSQDMIVGTDQEKIAAISPKEKDCKERKRVESREDRHQTQDVMVGTAQEKTVTVSPKEKDCKERKRVESREDRRQTQDIMVGTAQEKTATVSPQENDSREMKRVESREDRRKSQDMIVGTAQEKTATVSPKENDSRESKRVESREDCPPKSQDKIIETVQKETSAGRRAVTAPSGRPTDRCNQEAADSAVPQDQSAVPDRPAVDGDRWKEDATFWTKNSADQAAADVSRSTDPAEPPSAPVVSSDAQPLRNEDKRKLKRRSSSSYDKRRQHSDGEKKDAADEQQSTRSGSPRQFSRHRSGSPGSVGSDEDSESRVKRRHRREDGPAVVASSSGGTERRHKQRQRISFSPVLAPSSTVATAEQPAASAEPLNDAESTPANDTSSDTPTVPAEEPPPIPIPTTFRRLTFHKQERRRRDENGESTDVGQQEKKRPRWCVAESVIGNKSITISTSSLKELLPSVPSLSASMDDSVLDLSLENVDDDNDETAVDSVVKPDNESGGAERRHDGRRSRHQPVSDDDQQEDPAQRRSSSPVGRRRQSSAEKQQHETSPSVDARTAKQKRRDEKREKKRRDRKKSENGVAESADAAPTEIVEEGPRPPPLVLKRTVTQNVKDSGGRVKVVEVGVSAAAASRMERLPSPARNTKSAIVHIRNLVRPFTVNQLKELLARTGTVTDFWIDNIKSKCFCQYETKDQSVETRTALHGVRWPPSNPKRLIVDYTTAEDLDQHKALSEPIPRKTEPLRVDPFFATRQQELLRQESVQQLRRESVREWDKVKLGERSPGEKERQRELRKRQRLENSEQAARGDRSKDRAEDKGRDRAEDKGRDRVEDKGRDRAEDKGRDRAEDKGRDRADDRNRDRAEDRGRERGEDRKEKRRRDEVAVEVQPAIPAVPEPPVKLLDDLFRKTKCTPSIYWLPMTDQQVADKEQQRRDRMAERKKRLEALQQEDKEKEKRPSRSRTRSRSGAGRR